MRYRKLPKTDFDIGEVSFGCMSLGGDDHQNKQLLLQAFDHGINYFDTADIYQNGQNEITVGRALKEIRDQVIIATKVGNQPKTEGSGWDWNPSKSYILNAVEDSLKRLQTDYIDIYQLHGGTIDDPIEETIEAFETLKQKGMIRHYGISSIRPNVIRRWAEQSDLVSNMTQYSLLDRRPEESTLEHMGDQQVGVMVRGALAKGLLLGKPPKDYLEHSQKEVGELVDQMRSMPDRTLGQLALQYVLSRKEVTTAVVGIRTIEQLEDVISAANTPELSSEELSILSNAIQAHTYADHR